MWVTLVLVGIFSTFGPAPGSIEGLVCTVLPAARQLIGDDFFCLMLAFARY
jgi:hypothetical protein